MTLAWSKEFGGSGDQRIDAKNILWTDTTAFYGIGIDEKVRAAKDNSKICD